MADSDDPLGRIFISYRRQETAYAAGWLYDRLAGRYGKDQVFKDVDSIELGDDFVDVLTRAVASCDVLLALIGDEWLTVTDKEGRRLDDPSDFVRLEIETALARKIRVVPILVDGAQMPDDSEVPPSLAALVRRQALELRPAHFDSDLEQLLEVLDLTLAEAKATGAGPRHTEGSRRPAPAPLSPPGNTASAGGTTSTHEPHRTDVGAGHTIAPPAPNDATRDASPPPHPGPTPPVRRWTRPLLVTALLLAAVTTAGILWPRGSTPTSSSASTELAWRPLTFPVTTALDAPGVAQHQGKVWVVGGGGSRDVHVLDPKTGKWEQGPPLPQAVNHAALVSDGTSLFLIGGLSYPSNEVRDTVYRLRSPEGTWALDAPLPQPRFAGAAVWDGKRVVFAGGAPTLRPRAAAAEVWALDQGRWVPLGRLSKAREHLGAATDGAGTIWFAGGANVGAEGGAVYDEVDVVRQAKVEAAGKLSRPAQGLAAVWTAESGMCVIGGSTTLPNATAAPITDVRCAKDSGNTPVWPQLATPVFGAGATVVDGTVFVLGGKSGSGPAALALGSR
jgi:hypothetical protein